LPGIAAILRVRDGTSFVIDGPFTETREQIAGHFPIDAKDRDERSAEKGTVPLEKQDLSASEEPLT
jgi:hypothetical protein